MSINCIPVVLTIAGTDPSSGAGMLADLRVIQSLGCYGTGVVTAVTAQNTTAVSRVWPLSREQVSGQAVALLEDVRPDAVKVGMLGNAEAARGVLDTLERFACSNVVVDTILLSSSGALLFDQTDKDLLFEIMKRATVVTPNLPEAETLLGTSGLPVEEMARRLSDKCCGVSVLLTGGHGKCETVTDTFYNAAEDNLIYITHARVETPNTHGTGCALSAALACHLAKGNTLSEAAHCASEFVYEALAAGQSFCLGHGHGPAFFG